MSCVTKVLDLKVLYICSEICRHMYLICLPHLRQMLVQYVVMEVLFYNECVALFVSAVLG